MGLRGTLAMVGACAIAAFALPAFASPAAADVEGPESVAASPAGAAAAGSESAGPPVVVIAVDEIPTAALIDRRGRISRNRFPNLARLSREGVFYPNHTTVADWTYLAIPAILGGNYPSSTDTYQVFESYPVNLFSWMSDGGYTIDGREAVTQVCPRNLCPLPDDEFFDPADFESPIWFLKEKARVGVNTWRDRDRNLEWARNVRIAPGHLVFNHFLLPHRPYLHLPTGQIYSPGPVPATSLSDAIPLTGPIGNVRLFYQRMLLQIGFVDRIIRELRRNAVRRGLWKRTMLVVVGDHGIENRRGRLQRRTKADNVGSLAFTPLFVKYPGTVSGGTSRKATVGIDVFPTIAEQVGLRVPLVDGRPIADLSGPPRDIRIVDETFPFEQARLNRDRAVTWRDGLIGAGGLYRLGKWPGLIGRKLSRRRAGKARVFLDGRSRHASVRPRARKVPAMITGTADLRPGSVIAITVNGVIRATAEIFRDGSANRFGAMIKPGHFRAGNRIGVYRVKNGRPKRRLD